MLLSITALAFIFIIGLIVGSFMNVVILRTVSEESIVFPGSKCPKCQTPLKWYHNIPVLSYLFLRGKCAFCHEHISWQYPIVELLTGIVFVVLFLKYCSPFDELFGLSVFLPINTFQILLYIFALIVSCLFIALCGTDILEKKVSDAHTYSLIGTGVVFSIIFAIYKFILYSQTLGFPDINLGFFATCPVIYSLAGGILGFLIMEAISLFTLAVISKRAFGEGDSYIAAGIGSVFGTLMSISSLNFDFSSVIRFLVSVLILSVVIQVIFVIPIFIKKLIEKKNIYTLSAFSGFIVYTAGYLLAQNLGWLNHPAAYWSSTIVLLVLGMITCKELLQGLKTNENDGLYLPFGPAMVVAAFIALILLPM